MIEWPNYSKATNAAYQVLVDFDISTLPVPILPLIQNLPNLCAIPYSEFCNRQGISPPDFMSLNVSDRGFIVKNAKESIIFYNDFATLEITRFTLGHELGHYILKHTEETFATDKEANCFARNLLCPIPVTEAFKLDNVDDCCDIFDISPSAARVVLDKRSTDLCNISDSLYRKVYEIFDLKHLTKEMQLKQCFLHFLQTIADFPPFTDAYSLAI